MAAQPAAALVRDALVVGPPDQLVTISVVTATAREIASPTAERASAR